MILAILGKLAAVGLGGIAALWLLQDRLIYHPGTERPDIALVGDPTVREITLTTEDGLALLAWQAPPATATSPVLLYLHGNGGTLAHRAGRMRQFLARGWGVLMVEWRGYGGNPGSPGEAGLAADARAGLAALQAADVPAGRIVLWGESLGTGLAVRLAAEQPAAVGAVVLESPYTSLLEVGRLHYPFLPVGPLLRDRYDSLSRIAALRAPLLVMVGGRDTLVPPAMGRALVAAATAPAELWEAPLAGHNERGSQGALAAAADFLARRLPPAAAR